MRIGMVVSKWHLRQAAFSIGLSANQSWRTKGMNSSLSFEYTLTYSRHQTLQFYQVTATVECNKHSFTGHRYQKYDKDCWMCLDALGTWGWLWDGRWQKMRCWRGAAATSGIFAHSRITGPSHALYIFLFRRSWRGDAANSYISLKWLHRTPVYHFDGPSIPRQWDTAGTKCQGLWQQNGAS